MISFWGVSPVCPTGFDVCVWVSIKAGMISFWGVSPEVQQDLVSVYACQHKPYAYPSGGSPQKSNMIWCVSMCVNIRHMIYFWGVIVCMHVNISHMISF